MNEQAKSLHDIVVENYDYLSRAVIVIGEIFTSIDENPLMRAILSSDLADLERARDAICSLLSRSGMRKSEFLRRMSIGFFEIRDIPISDRLRDELVMTLAAFNPNTIDADDPVFKDQILTWHQRVLEENGIDDE